MLAPLITNLPGFPIERPILTPIRALFPELAFPEVSSPTSPRAMYHNYYLNENSVDGPLLQRPRRRFHEIERIYTCRHEGCTKAYGALNHLNTHIFLKGHGFKRTPREFAALRRAMRERELRNRFRYVDPRPALHSIPSIYSCSQ
ncbi:hypothetical protein DSO57_1035172 [Entomophthora muscae]|uniref:Uncharacterized protein n=1 Tax=Entomophthora muscae TaxID=34485 RepID=A0ACC2UJW9_9FUNG|nr:hypothetical protein DSO57_1035172 [Entomophthora muscae]